jgi:4-alpha-glucanotransferase
MEQFEFFLEDHSTDEQPEVVIEYDYLEGDASVGLKDDFEIYVTHGGKEIWNDLTSVEQHEVYEAVEDHFKKSIEEWNQP